MSKLLYLFRKFKDDTYNCIREISKSLGPQQNKICKLSNVNCSVTWLDFVKVICYLWVCFKTEIYFHRTVASPSKQAPPTAIKCQTCDFLFTMRTRHVQVLPSGFYIPDVNGRIISSSYNLRSNMSPILFLFVKICQTSKRHWLQFPGTTE